MYIYGDILSNLWGSNAKKKCSILNLALAGEHNLDFVVYLFGLKNGKLMYWLFSPVVLDLIPSHRIVVITLVYLKAGMMR